MTSNIQKPTFLQRSAYAQELALENQRRSLEFMTLAHQRLRHARVQSGRLQRVAVAPVRLQDQPLNMLLPVGSVPPKTHGPESSSPV